MKKILITGANSYIGTSAEKWLNKYPDKYTIDTLDMRGDYWKLHDFSKYDVVFHIAGIAHIKTTKENRDLYYKINTELAVETAKKAKAECVKQFVFMSSMSSMYGSNLVQGKLPKTVYGESKLLAEQQINPLGNDNFKIAILKPPMVYGKGCKGNFPKLVKLAHKTPIFPNFPNKRSMIYIDNLCEFVRLIIDNEDSGVFYPQNSEYVCTSELVKIVNPKIRLIKIFNPFIRLLRNRVGLMNKVFGDLVYDQRLSKNFEYCVVNFEESIIQSV
ncbi:MAG: NAD-dependent epimerase/dehydratase family protein [Clostridiales bacterium]|nr:NAD-dependent epimerase/dehydratase family protein [Clostridiales bacterium]